METQVSKVTKRKGRHNLLPFLPSEQHTSEQNGPRARLRRAKARRNRPAYDATCFTGQCLLFLIGMQLAGVFLFFNADLAMDFLRGPRRVYKPSLPGQDSPRRPEDPRPPADIFYALTRKEKKELKEKRMNFESLRSSNKLVPCRLDEDCFISSYKSMFFRGSAPTVLLHNPLPVPRYFCGHKILGSGGTLEVDASEVSSCSTPYVWSPKPPPVSGEGMRPVELYWNLGDIYSGDAFEEDYLRAENFPCSIPCLKNGDYALLSVISVRDTKWEIMSTMEGKGYYSEAKVKGTSYTRDKFYASTSFDSEIPLPYFSWSEYHIQNPPVDFNTAIKGASFLANNCDSMNHREIIVQALMDSPLRVDSLSGCMHNAAAPRGVNLDNRTAVLERYLFHLAFENQRTDDYITEKLWDTLASGTLPIYFGAPNIKQHVPDHSVVFVDDFTTSNDLANHLVRLTKDKALYESYHAWRFRPIDPVFAAKYDFTHTHSTCRICKWAYARRHGLEWNHTRQEVQEPWIPHKTCRNKHGLIGHPFKEYWLSQDGNTDVPVKEAGSGTKTCTLDDSNRVLEIGDGELQRKVYDQDGVTDLVIDSKGGGGYVLKLETPIASSDLHSTEDAGQIWWLQDGLSRMTILTSAPVSLSVTDQGTVQLQVSSYIRIRVVVENLDTFHKGASTRTNYFGEVMKEDFFDPVEAYKVS